MSTTPQHAWVTTFYKLHKMTLNARSLSQDLVLLANIYQGLFAVQLLWSHTKLTAGECLTAVVDFGRC